MPFAGLFAKIAWGALFSRAKSNAVNDWHAIPPKAKLWLLGATAAVALFFVHQHFAHKALAEAYRNGRNDYAAKVEQQARSISEQAATLTGRINAKLKDQHNAELAHIHASADALRVRGPGAAVCRDPALSAAAGGHVGKSGSANAAVDRLPDPERSQLIALPFTDTTRFAEQHDALRSEVKTWREWYPKMVAAWDDLRKQVGGDKSR